MLASPGVPGKLPPEPSPERRFAALRLAAAGVVEVMLRSLGGGAGIDLPFLVDAEEERISSIDLWEVDEMVRRGAAGPGVVGLGRPVAFSDCHENDGEKAFCVFADAWVAAR